MQRRQDIELLRLLSAFGIVWFHSAATGIAVAYSGLVAFLVLSIYLSGKPAAVGLVSLRARATRLLVPWLVWFAIYGGVNALRGLEVLPLEQGLAAGVLAGPSIHLWYLPFIFMCLMGVDVLKAHAAPALLAYGAGIGALALVATAPLWRPLSLTWPYPALQWADAAAPVAMGLFLQNAPAIARSHRLAMASALLGCAMVVAAFEPVGVSYAIGLAACLLIASGRTASSITVKISPLSDLSFGIYLSHSLVFLLLLSCTTLPRSLMPFAIFAGAAALVAALRWLAPRYRNCWS